MRAVGLSVNDHDPGSALRAVASGLFDTVQVIYNIFDQAPEERLLPLCREHGVGVLARVPFDEGGLTGTITPETTFPPGDWRELYFKGERKRQVWERNQASEGPARGRGAFAAGAGPALLPGPRGGVHGDPGHAAAGERRSQRRGIGRTTRCRRRCAPN